MEPTPASCLEGRRPAIKARWAALLQAAAAPPPTGPAFVAPKMLIYLIDATLARLTDRLGEPRAVGPRRDLTPFQETRAGCQCGLHLLLTYYLAGAQTLREVLPPELGAAREEVLLCFDRLGHDEMAALRSICHYRGGPLCRLKTGTTINPPGAAASPARPWATARLPAGTPG